MFLSLSFPSFLSLSKVNNLEKKKKVCFFLRVSQVKRGGDENWAQICVILAQILSM